MEIMPVAAHPVASGQIHRVRPLSDHQRRRRSSTSLSSSSSTTTTTTTTLDVAPVVPFALLLPSGPETSTSRQRTATQEASSNVGRVGRSRSRRRKQNKQTTTHEEETYTTHKRIMQIRLLLFPLCYSIVLFHYYIMFLLYYNIVWFYYVNHG